MTFSLDFIVCAVMTYHVDSIQGACKDCKAPIFYRPLPVAADRARFERLDKVCPSCGKIRFEAREQVR